MWTFWSAIWIQDWAGQIYTDFGDRVFWNWEWNSTHYPELDTIINDFDKRGVYFLNYINPHLINSDQSKLYLEGEEKLRLRILYEKIFKIIFLKNIFSRCFNFNMHHLIFSLAYKKSINSDFSINKGKMNLFMDSIYIYMICLLKSIFRDNLEINSIKASFDRVIL